MAQEHDVKMLCAALAYRITLQKPIIPLCWPDHGTIHRNHLDDCSQKGKIPLISRWERYGSILPSIAEVRSWWRQWPEANIGGPTGHLWGIALDVDARHDGDHELERRGLLIPDTPTNLTGGGGIHAVLEHPGFPVPNKVGLFPGVDIRGDRGQIVLPPSLHQSGKRYTWEMSSRPESTSLAPCPAWLIDALKACQTPVARTADEPIKQGERNAFLTSLAGSMRRRGCGQAAIEAALEIENQERCAPPLLETEVQRIAGSIAKYPPNETIGRFRNRNHPASEATGPIRRNGRIYLPPVVVSL